VVQDADEPVEQVALRGDVTFAGLCRARTRTAVVTCKFAGQAGTA
jgi:hypothetical protein